MPASLCADRTAHGPHEWYEKWILRRECPGIVVDLCGQPGTHINHWHGEYRDEWCPGTGLAGRCVHGVQMLDHCDDCADTPDLAESVTDAIKLQRRNE